MRNGEEVTGFTEHQFGRTSSFSENAQNSWIPWYNILIKFCMLSDFFSTFLGTVPIPVQLGKIALFSLQLGKLAPLNLNENTGWKCHGPIPRAIKIIISNLNWQ